MSIYDEALLSIEGLPHTIKVPLRRALKRAKKVEELLEMMNLKDIFLEDYYTSPSLRGSQMAFDRLRAIKEEIANKEEELEKMD